MIEEFNRLCLFRQNHPGIKGNVLNVKDPVLKPVYDDLLSIQEILENNYAGYRGFDLSFDISWGQGNFPNVFHVSILPPKQKVSNGIYVVICFDIRGNGAVVGCAESVTNSKGLKTVERKKGRSKPRIDVDGSGKTTKYNNCFNNPIEFFYRLESDAGLLSHITHSLDIALAEVSSTSGPVGVIDTRNIDVFDAKNLDDGRKKVARLITARIGQQNFRNEILNAYGSKCAVTANPIGYVIEAAHIIPYLGKKTNHIQNGLPLRSDIHLLFDLGMISIDALSYKIKVSKKLFTTDYWQYNETAMLLPKDKVNYPSTEALKYHNQLFDDKEGH